MKGTQTMEIIMKPIGYIKSRFTKKEDLPMQSVLKPDQKATIEILPEFTEGLEGIEAGSYRVILFHFHKSETTPLQVVSRATNKKTGVFDTRSPNRPNGIGLSIVKITKVDENLVEFEGVDMLDGTPVLDIKPYSSQLNPKGV